jgi:DNA invertase Pin-like site-specific DNA recombinase
MFQMLGVFAEFERAMIQERVRAFRQSQPGVLSERLASFFKTSLKHESFKTARNVEKNARVFVPFLEPHLFPQTAQAIPR